MSTLRHSYLVPEIPSFAQVCLIASSVHAPETYTTIVTLVNQLPLGVTESYLGLLKAPELCYVEGERLSSS